MGLSKKNRFELRIARTERLGTTGFNAKELCTPLGQQPLRGERREESEPLIVGGTVRGAALILMTEQLHLGRIKKSVKIHAKAMGKLQSDVIKSFEK